jgi:hypothetical protein
MAQQNNIAQQLNDLLVTRNFHPDMLDAQGKVSNSEDAKTFTFDYISSSGKNYGTMVVILDSDNDVKAFYGDNLGRSMEGDDKNEFFDFQQHLSQFANARRYTYTAKDLGQLKHTMQGLAAIKEGLFEGYYGTRRISYAGEPTEARLMIRHNRNLGENDARFRYVESIFVETADGERYRLPFTNLAGGRAMLEHVRQGGKPYDVRGNHICEMITELKVLTRFNRASQGRVLEGITQGVVEGAQTYYKSLRESIKRLSSPRGYSAYFESWHPANITEQDQLVEDIKTLFVEQTIDDRIEQALPLLAKIQRGREMKEADIFENWANTLAEGSTEGTWSLPETPEQLTRLKTLMSGELIVGPDGTNATEQLYDLIGDDVLFDRIRELAQQDPRANLWDDSMVQARMQELGIQMPNRAEPDMDAQPQQAMAEAGFPGAPDVEMPPMEPSGDPQRDELKQEYMDLHREIKSLVDLQYRSTSEEQKMQAKARIKQLNDRADEIKAILEPRQPPNEWQKKTYGFDDNWNKVNQGMTEADNIAAFESLQRMRHLSGMPLQESRIEESSEFMYEKIGKTLAQQQPMLDVNSDQFVHAVYDEMIDMGMTPKSAKHKLSYDQDFLGDVANSFYHYAQHGELDENLGGIVGEAGAGVQVRKVRSPNMVQVQGIPNPDITSWKFNDDPLPMTDLNSSPMAQGPDLTSGEPFADEVEYDGKWIPRIHMSGVGKTHDDEETLDECNYTMENAYCPVHGLKECWLEEMNESILATGSRLIKDLDEDYGPPGPPGGKVRAMGTNVFKRGPKSTGAYDTKAGYFGHPEYRDATRSQADNDREKRISDWETMTGQDEPRLIGAQPRPIPPRTPTPRTSAAMAKPVPSAKITATDLPDEVDDQGRQYFQNYMIDTDGKRIPRIRVDGVGRTQDESMDEGVIGAAVRGAGELGGKAANAVKSLFKAEPEAVVKMKHQRGTYRPEADRQPDTSNSLTAPGQGRGFMGGRDLARAEVPNVTRTADGHPTVKYRSDGRTYSLRTDPSLDSLPPVTRADGRTFPAGTPTPDLRSQVATTLNKNYRDVIDRNMASLATGSRQKMNFSGMTNPNFPSGDYDVVKLGKTLDLRGNPRDTFATKITPTNTQQVVRKNNNDIPNFLKKGADNIDEDMTDVGDVVGQAARSVTDRLGQAASDVYEPIGNFFKGVKQGYNGKAQTAPVPSPKIDIRNLPDEEPDQSDAEFVQSPDEAGRSLNYESREGDAMLARIKSLALLR